MEAYLGFVAAAMALAGSPGPNTLSLAAVGAAYGWRRGIGYMLGLNIGMLGVIAITGSGATALVFALPGAAQVIAILAAVYFAYLAWRIATAPPLSDAQSDATPPSWIAACFVSLANPKAYAAMAAMFSGFTLVGSDTLTDGLTKALVLIGVIIAVNIVWLGVGAALTPWFRNPTTSRIINVFFALALLIAVAAALLL